MPILTVRDWDQTGELAGTPDNNSASKNVMETLGAALSLIKSRQKAQQDKAMREKIMNGQGGASMEYDPATGKSKYKIEQAKPDSLAAKVQRFITGQQFGVDPVTNEPIANPKKPRFGYQGNNIWGQLLNQEDEDLQVDPQQMQGVPPPAPPKRRGIPFVPAAAASDEPSLEILQDPTGAGPKTLTPQEHYNQLRANGVPVKEARKIAGV